MKSLRGREKLDQFALDIEFLLISVVQGVALSVLATQSVQPFSELNWPVILYIISAFLVIIIFWSQAIIHALSFIDWPLDLGHNFLYFLFSFVEVMAYSKVGNPLHWFGFMTALFVVSLVLYVADYRLIMARKGELSKALYVHIIGQHRFEMQYLVPAGIVFNLVAFLVIMKFPHTGFHIYFIIAQIVFQCGILLNATKSFTKRARLI